MKKRTLILVTGALLVTGGTTVYASSNSETNNQNNSGYPLDENIPNRNQNERKDIENYHHEMNPSDAEFEDDYYNSNYGMMKSRKNNHFRSHCGFHR